MINYNFNQGVKENCPSEIRGKYKKTRGLF